MPLAHGDPQGSQLSPNKTRQPTFFAVVLVVMQHKATSALALVAAEGVQALVLASPVILGTFIFV